MKSKETEQKANLPDLGTKINSVVDVKLTQNDLIQYIVAKKTGELEAERAKLNKQYGDNSKNIETITGRMFALLADKASKHYAGTIKAILSSNKKLKVVVEPAINSGFARNKMDQWSRTKMGGYAFMVSNFLGGMNRQWEGYPGDRHKDSDLIDKYGSEVLIHFTSKLPKGHKQFDKSKPLEFDYLNESTEILLRYTVDFSDADVKETLAERDAMKKVGDDIHKQTQIIDTQMRDMRSDSEKVRSRITEQILNQSEEGRKILAGLDGIGNSIFVKTLELGDGKETLYHLRPNNG